MEPVVALLTTETVVKDEKVIIVQHAKGTVHLLGTHHNRENSALAVDELIRIVRPHVVAVELCRTNLERYNVLTEGGGQPPAPAADEVAPKSSHMDIIPARLRDKAIGEELLLGLVSESLKYDRWCVHRNRGGGGGLRRSALLKNPQTRRFRVRPKVFHDVVIGREMCAPFRDYTWTLPKPHSRYLVHPATKYRILLADKPVEETFCSVAAALTDEERSIVHIYQANFLKLFVASSATKTIMMNMIEKNARLYDAIVRQRDRHMARALRQALDDADTRPREKARVLAIVGKSHIAGIVNYWHTPLPTRSTAAAAAVRPPTRAKR